MASKAPAKTSVSAAAVQTLIDFHELSKHHPQRYAPGPGRLDWAKQPNPFRSFHESGKHQLRFAIPDKKRTPMPTLSYDRLYEPSAVAAQPLNLENLSMWFYHSMALSAMKQHKSASWSLRVNPSSGNLHPTEAYIVLPPDVIGAKASACVCHYSPQFHALERRVDMPASVWESLTAHVQARPAAEHKDKDKDSKTAGKDSVFFVGLSSIYWRESWKYGVRAFRYCQHDTGHALAALRYACALLGWRMKVIDSVADAEIDSLFGLDRAKDFDGDTSGAEHGELVAAVFTDDRPLPQDLDIPAEAIAAVKSLSSWVGTANQLSASVVSYPSIDSVAAVTRKPRESTVEVGQSKSDEKSKSAAASVSVSVSLCPVDKVASEIIRQRRSAVDMDGHTGLSSKQFFCTLQRLMPSASAVPWDVVSWPVRTHLALFVHRVKGLPPGLYVLVRDAHQTDQLKSLFDKKFAWSKAEGSPESLPLYLLKATDTKQIAQMSSCQQEIAGDSAFAVAMLANFAEIYEGKPWLYRRLFWEAGVIGQVLYLEAEAHGIRGTGIGCFFDDIVHELVFDNSADSSKKEKEKAAGGSEAAVKTAAKEKERWAAFQLQDLYHFTGKLTSSRCSCS